MPRSPLSLDRGTGHDPLRAVFAEHNFGGGGYTSPLAGGKGKRSKKNKKNKKNIKKRKTSPEIAEGQGEDEGSKTPSVTLMKETSLIDAVATASIGFKPVISNSISAPDLFNERKVHSLGWLHSTDEGNGNQWDTEGEATSKTLPPPPRSQTSEGKSRVDFQPGLTFKEGMQKLAGPRPLTQPSLRSLQASRSLKQLQVESMAKRFAHDVNKQRYLKSARFIRWSELPVTKATPTTRGFSHLLFSLLFCSPHFPLPQRIKNNIVPVFVHVVLGYERRLRDTAERKRIEEDALIGPLLRKVTRRRLLERFQPWKVVAMRS